MNEQENTTEVAEEETFEDRLTRLVQQGLERAKELDKQILVSVTREIDPIDPLALFVNGVSFATERWYWEEPSRDSAMVALDVASATMPPRRRRYQRSDELRESLIEDAIYDPPVGEDNPGPRYCVGYSFDPERKPDWRIWHGFPAAYFLLPKATLVKEGDRHFLTYNLLTRASSDPKIILNAARDLNQKINRALQREPDAKKWDVAIVPDEEKEQEENEAYRSLVSSATEAVRGGQFEKVVAARQREIRAKLVFHVPDALEQLRQEYPDCYIYCIGRHNMTFLGASPEQLVKLDDKQVSTVCLAGSIRRGETPEEDEQLGQQLLDSGKDRHEHDVCVRAIRESLEPLCSELDVPESPELMSVSNVHHLRTPIHGTLSNGATLVQLIEKLHPTPAVGGYPKDEAVTFLRENEGFDRGWYAAPLGWIDSHGNGEFIVTLRSALIRGPRAYLYAGCGIVSESDADQEMAESEVKLWPMLKALGGDQEPEDEDEETAENDDQAASTDGEPDGDSS